MLRRFVRSPLFCKPTQLSQVRSNFFFQWRQRLSVKSCAAKAELGVRPFSSNHNDDKMKVSSTDLKLVIDAAKEDENSIKAKDSTSMSDIPGAQTGGKKLAIVFTCTVCGTRSAKQFTEQAYRNGVVMVRCPGCENLHLIADRLGFFEDESWDIQKAMQKMGEQVTAINDNNVLELTLKDVVGDKMMKDNDFHHDEKNVIESTSNPKNK